jgi:hypothetical protein
MRFFKQNTLHIEVIREDGQLEKVINNKKIINAIKKKIKLTHLKRLILPVHLRVVL